jgi:anti-sigma regulatory factor (Ser/Thr protein kinase)
VTRQAFARRVDTLAALVAFTDAALAPSALDEARRQAVHLAIEELFTNMVKYSPAGAPTIVIEISCSDGAADVTLIDAGVEAFDPTRAPAVRTDPPLEQREPGGLGLHLTRRLVDSMHYEHDAERGEGRTRFRVGPADARPTAAGTASARGDDHAQH